LELLPLLLPLDEAVSSLDFVAGDATPGFEEFAVPAEAPRAFEDSSKFGVGEGVTMCVEASDWIAPFFEDLPFRVLLDNSLPIG